MAVTLRKFLPDAGTLNALACLRAPVTVMRPISAGKVSNVLFLTAAHDVSLCLSADWHDVVFKFEIFSLGAKNAERPAFATTDVVGLIQDWNVIKCLFRFEWERSARPGEVPSHWEQIVRRRGERGEISPLASAIGVSMVGLSFWSAGHDSPVAAIMMDDDADDPTALRFYGTSEEVGLAIAGTEKVTLEDFPSWSLQLNDWR